ncbi:MULTISPECIES: NfeD family protein [Roseobacter]|uniref:NfeD family protein n=1 Tax=Roseobacter TaxID=2433 RepID=UPI001BC673D8|nr:MULTISPECIES: hypothetical protein [Roseobacter]GIT85458.1 hypothetical protein ROBYS_04740 [Roseobacter sp. OBYS 0001]
MIGALGLWWVWLAAALVLGLAEVLLPGFIFLGFAIAAILMSGVVLIAPELGAPALLAVYGGGALICWIGLRVVFRNQSSGARIVTKDINDN